MRVKAETSRQIIDHLFTCAYCNLDIQCQHIPTSLNAPEQACTLHQQLLNHLKPEQHVGNEHQLVINILETQTILHQYQELQHYTVFKPQC